MGTLRRARPKRRPSGGARTPDERALTSTAVQYLASLLNVDEAILYLREECGVPDDVAAEFAQTLQESVGAMALTLRWPRP